MQQSQNDADLVDLLLEGARYGDLVDVQQALEQGAATSVQDQKGRTGDFPADSCW